jgi:hypothetical protein
MAGLYTQPNALSRNRTPSDCLRKYPNLQDLLDQNAQTTILELEVGDKYPDLMVLKRIEESGCVFTGFLRKCIRTKINSFLKDFTSEIGVISIRKISYLAQRNDDFHIIPGSCNGLHSLIVTMDIQVPESSSVGCFIRFDVFADEVKPRSNINIILADNV